MKVAHRGFPDPLHPNQAGYEKWAAVLRRALSRSLADRGDRAPVSP